MARADLDWCEAPATADGDRVLDAAEAQQRFQDARTRGNRDWLWPALPIERWARALADIEGATRAVLAGDAAAALRGEDAAALGIASYTSGMGPLLGCWIEAGQLAAPADAAALLARHLAHNRARVARLTAIARDVVGALAERGIAPTIVKGMQTAHHDFPEPGARCFSDIDLLVTPAEQAAAEATLAALGYLPGAASGWSRGWQRGDSPALPRTLELVHRDDPWSVDLHQSLDKMLGGRTAALDSLRAGDEGEPWRPDSRARVARQPLQLLHLAVHASAGLINLTLLRQAELVLTIRRDTALGRLDWAKLVADGRGLLGFAWPALQMAERLAPGVVPPEALDECRAEAPAAVRRVVGGLTPASAQRVVRCSIEEKFMWADSWPRRARQLALEIMPPGSSVGELRDLYWDRLFRVWRRKFSR